LEGIHKNGAFAVDGETRAHLLVHNAQNPDRESWKVRSRCQKRKLDRFFCASSLGGDREYCAVFAKPTLSEVVRDRSAH
jgi:hypothetical protein